MRHPPKPKATRQREWIEPLEARIAPATLVVSTLKDITNNTHSTGSLRDALYLGDAATGQVTDIVFQTTVRGHTVPLKGLLTISSALPAITNDINITAPGVVLNAAEKVQGLSITGDSTGVSISGLIIVNGKAAAGGDLSITGGTNISLNGIVLVAGRANTGGGLYVNDPAETITITDSVITGNVAQGLAGNESAAHGYGYAGLGGGIANLGGTVALVGDAHGKMVVLKNFAIGGTGDTGGQGPTGYAGGKGGGAGIFNADTLTVTSSTITGNVAVGGTGGASINYAPYTVARGSNIPNTPGGDGGMAYGGGIGNGPGGSVSISNSVISGNVAVGGSGTSAGRASVGTNGYNFTVAPNMGFPLPTPPTDGNAGGNGMNGGSGGLGVGAGIGGLGAETVYLARTTVSGNVSVGGHAGNGSAGGNGGNGGKGGSYAGHSYPAGNGGAAGNGGNAGFGGMGIGAGLYSGGSGGSLTLFDSTVSGNAAVSMKPGLAGAAGHAGKGYMGGAPGLAGHAASYLGSRGGGVASQYGTLVLHQDTIAFNAAHSGGGISVYQDTSATVHNCTISFNAAFVAGGYGGLFFVPDSGGDKIDVISSIIAENANLNVDTTQFDVGSGFNLTSGNPGLGPLKLHAPGSTITTGATATILPYHKGPAVVGGPGANPDSETGDQDGNPFGSSIDIGSVQTPF